MDPKESRKRKREWFFIGFLTLLVVASTVAEIQLSKFSSSLPLVSSIFFFGLINVNIILLIAIVWLVFRNIGKLFIERRSRILGARLKSKLVLAFLGFSIVPTLVLFLISSMYINSSFDKWFSLRIQNTLQASLDITRAYYKNTDHMAMRFAENLSKQLGHNLSREDIDSFGGAPAWLKSFIGKQRELLDLNAIEFYFDPMDERVISQRERQTEVKGEIPEAPAFYPRLSLDLLEQAFSGEKLSHVQHMGTGDLIRTLVPVRAQNGTDETAVTGVLAVNTYIPVSLVNRVDEIASVFDDYRDTNPLKYPIKTTYFVILIMITLVLIFVEIWIGLYYARELTVPIEKLVHGAQEVGSGNLDVSVERTGQDEIGTLVDSFNKMTRDLKENRAQLTQTAADLEKRRLQLEAVLANIGAGVVVVDHAGEITTFNRAAAQLLEIPQQKVMGKKFKELFRDNYSPLLEIIERAMETAGASAGPEVTQWNFHASAQMKSLAAIATSLRDSEMNWGVVAVIDDMTHLIKAQREVAWREVARRIAHEIKNPLTPIKLSAQRLQRRLGNLSGQDGELLNECTGTIVKHTDELKEMVNEFSNFARLPEISPAMHQLNTAIREVAALFSQAHPAIDFDLQLDELMPSFEFDRDQIKRVLINLVDNAVAALKSTPERHPSRIGIETRYDEKLKIATIALSDNGPGIPDDIKPQIFEPYFSTKQEGTGLGLAIVKRIITDHEGFVRVHSSAGKGTQFLIELPTEAKIRRPRDVAIHSGHR